MGVASFKPPSVVETLLDDLCDLDSYLLLNAGRLHPNYPVNFLAFTEGKKHSFTAVFLKKMYLLDEFKEYVRSDDQLDKKLETIVSKLRSLMLTHTYEDLVKQLRRTGATLTKANPKWQANPLIEHDLIFEGFSISF